MLAASLVELASPGFNESPSQGSEVETDGVGHSTTSSSLPMGVCTCTHMCIEYTHVQTTASVVQICCNLYATKGSLVCLKDEVMERELQNNR